jgi:hypothetical protein
MAPPLHTVGDLEEIAFGVFAIDDLELAERF